jgi:hypothetical protein
LPVLACRAQLFFCLIIVQELIFGLLQVISARHRRFFVGKVSFAPLLLPLRLWRALDDLRACFCGIPDDLGTCCDLLCCAVLFVFFFGVAMCFFVQLLLVLCWSFVFFMVLYNKSFFVS